MLFARHTRHATAFPQLQASAAFSAQRMKVALPVLSEPCTRIVLPMAGFGYRYELRDADEVISTGHLNRERPLQVGDRVEIGGRAGLVRTVEPLLHDHEVRLVVELQAGEK
jgi:hypothetical protein